jgi:hypothetical protein
MPIRRSQVVGRKTSFLARALADSTWKEEYVRSDGLCQGHLEIVFSQVDRSTASMLRDDHARRMKGLSRRLQELQRKQRYDVTEELTPDDARSWREARSEDLILRTRTRHGSVE